MRDTYIALYSSDMEVLYYNDYLDREACNIADQAYLQISALLPGTYYIMVEMCIRDRFTYFTARYSSPSMVNETRYISP